MRGQQTGVLAGWGPRGLVLEAGVAEQGGGFVKLSLAAFSPPLEKIFLGAYRALEFGAARRWPAATSWLCLCRRAGRPDRADPPEALPG